MKIKKLSPEFIFTFYIFGFAMLRPVLHFVQSGTSIVIAVFVGCTLVCSLCSCHKYNKKNAVIWGIVSALFLLLLSSSSYTAANEYRKNFFMYGIVPLFLLITVKDYTKVLHWSVKLSCINGLLLAYDPFLGYLYNGGYMEYGINMLMFSLFGLLIGFFYFRERYLLIPAIIEIILIAFFGNKGACISAIGLVMAWMVISGSRKKQILFSTVACVGLVSWRQLLLWIIDLAAYFGVSSYSITTMKLMLSANSDYVFSSRTDIWKIAQDWITQEPFWGHKIGAFEQAANGYVHNIFLDIALIFGIVGLILFVLLLLHSIYRMLRNRNVEYKLFQMSCLVCWLIQMQFSLTFWNVSFFWVYWGLYIYDGMYKRRPNQSFSTNV